MAKQFQKSALMIAVLTCFTHQVAAADILTEQSFKSGSTLEVTSPIDSVLLYKKNVNKDDQFTINHTTDKALHLNPTKNRGIVVNRYQNNLSLTINSHVSFGDSNQQLVVKKHNIDSEGLYETALVQVGNGSRQHNTGNLVINGNLSIRNVDFTGANKLISISGDGRGKRSSFRVQDVDIRDVNAGAISSIIQAAYADVNFGNITIANATAGSALNFDSDTNSTIGSLTIQGGSFKKNAVKVYDANIFGDLIIKGIADDKVLFTDKLIALENAATVGGDIVASYVEGGNCVLYANQNGDPKKRYLFNNIAVNNSDLKGSSFYQDGVISLEQVTYHLNNANVENTSFSSQTINEVSGIRLASAHSDQHINTLTVKNLYASATSGDTVHGISFETSSATQGIDSVVIDGVHATGVKTKGLSINGAYNKEGKAFEQHFGSININDVSSESKNAYGLYVSTHHSVHSGVVIDKATTITNIAAKAPNAIAYGVWGQDVTFNGGLVIKGLDAAYQYGIRAGEAFVDGISVNTGAQTINQIEGDILADKGGKLSASFANAQSYLQGRAYVAEGGTLNVNFDNGAYWNVTNNSTLTSLHIGQSSRVDLTHQRNPQTPKTYTIKTNRFNADNGLLVMKIDTTSQAGTTQLIVNGEASGTFSTVLDVVNGDQLTAENPKSASWLISQNGGSLSLDKVSYKDGAAKEFNLAFFEDGSQSETGTTTSTGNTGKWHLVLAPKGPDQGGGDKPPVTPEVDQILSLGTSTGQAVGMLSENEDIRLRMGNVRNGDADGLWVRTYARKDSARGSFGNGFEQDTYGMHIGADHLFTTPDNASWLIGGSFHYGRSDMDGVAEAGGGSADVNQYTFKAYATHLKENGTFVDLVLHAGYYDTELTGMNNTKTANFKADYTNWGYGVSAEVGHRFDLSNIANRWYVEPTAQLTWFHAEGKNFKTSTGLEINQGDADFITGRLGAAVGKVFALGTSNDPMSSYFSIAMKGGMLYQFDGDQTITAHGTDGATVVCADAMDMKGARAYYGITADWKIDDTWRVYGQISRVEGSGYTKDYEASFGVRYSF